MIPAFVMAVPWSSKRAIRAREISEQADATIVWDKSRDVIGTWTRLLRAVGDGAGILMEDDIQLTEGWREKVEAAIAEHPQVLIQFFSLRKFDLFGPPKPSRWMPGSSYLMNQCYYLPPGMAVDLVGAAGRWLGEHPEHPTGCDNCIQQYLKDTRQRYWLHEPSLVQHEPWTSEINPRRPRNRQSRTFVP